MSKKLFTLLIFFVLISLNSLAQIPNWIWAKGSGDTANSRGNSIVTDVNGNIIITGEFQYGAISFDTIVLTNNFISPNSYSDFFIVKYDPVGNVLWAKSAGGSSDDIGNSVATDINGNIIVTGKFGSDSITFGAFTITNPYANDSIIPIPYDIFIVKYDSSGNVLWAKSAGGSFVDAGTGIATDLSGNIFTTGFFNSASITFGTTTLTGSGNMFLVKYDPSGNLLWVNSASGAHLIRGTGITVDPFGNSIVTGWFNDSVSFGNQLLTNHGPGGSDFYIVKYDPSGNVLWAKSGGGNYNDGSYSIASDANGNIIATGYSQSDSINFGTITIANPFPGGPFGPTNLFTVKYDSSGNLLWARTDGGNDYDYSLSITTNHNGNCIITGYFQSDSITFGNYTLLNSAGSLGVEIFIVNFDSSGHVIWATTSGGNRIVESFCVGVNSTGDIFITGYYYDSLTIGTSILISGGATSMTFIAKLEDNITTVYTIDDGNTINIFPNPSSSIVVFTFSITRPENVTLKIFDINGRLIETLADKYFDKGENKIKYNLNRVESGIYFLTFSTSYGIETRKIVVSK